MRLPTLLLLTLAGLLPASLPANTELDEIHRLLSTNLPALGPDDLALPDADALLTRLGPRVRWADTNAAAPSSGDVVAGTRRFPGRHGYVRLSSVSGDVATRLESAVSELSRDEALDGLVLDLRFADGRDFAASARASALFFPTAEPVLDWGEGTYAAPGRTNRLAGPLVLLVNGETRGSAEALAAALRSAGLAVIVGGNTAGEAALWRNFPLTSGRTLQLAVAPVKTGDGLPIAYGGIVPDIRVSIPPDDERRYLSDPYAAASSAPKSTSEATAATPVRRRLTEAELMRNKRQALGQPDPSPIGPTSTPAAPAEKTIVQDPALARGLDVLTGLNAVKP